jgi:hypothetical protein
MNLDFGDFGGCTRTRTLDPLIKRLRKKYFKSGS